MVTINTDELELPELEGSMLPSDLVYILKRIRLKMPHSKQAVLMDRETRDYICQCITARCGK